MATTTVYILLGSNLGDRERFLQAARARVTGIEGMEVIAESTVYLTRPQDMEGEHPSFLNQVVKADYRYSPSELLLALEEIETHLGRTDKGGLRPRTIDLDILLFGDRTVESERLTLPHPRLLERPFALVPLVELDPDLTHPSTGRLLADHLENLNATTVAVYKDYVS